MAYIGPAPNPGQNREVDDISSGFNGGTASFTLQVNGQNVSPGSSNAIIVSLGGVVQNPGTDYTIAGSTITFTTNPASGLAFFGLVLGQGVDTSQPADGSVTTAKLASGAADLVNDTSPQLGGDLDTNSFEISLDDLHAVKFGDDADLSIFHQSGFNQIQSNNTSPIQIRDASNVMLRADPGGAVDLRHNGSVKLVTNSSGITVTGKVHATELGLDDSDTFVFTDNTRCDLFVNGNNEFRFESDGDFHADGDVIAQSTTISSDEKLKENIKVVSDALDKVEALRGVTFDWKRDGKSSAGVIAQDVMGVLPEAVKEVQGLNDKESYLSVNYHSLTSILIEAIKDLSAKIKVLEAK